MHRLVTMKVTVMATAVLLIFTLSGCGESPYDRCMESYRQLAFEAAQALLNGDDALYRSYEQQMSEMQLTCNIFNNL